MAGPSVDGVVALPDGTRLGLAELGDPAGRPVVSCHGGLSCRLDVRSADAAARRAGVRLVAPDRPGVGRSPRRPGRRVGDWPATVAALADHLGIATFDVLGWSMGAPYAVACAALLGDRVGVVALVAGGVPLDWPCAGGTFANRTDASLLAMARSRPDAARVLLEASRALVTGSPDVWMATTRRTLCERDVAVLERDGVPDFAAAVAGGLADPDGVVDEFLAYAAPWGFAYEEVERPVVLWQGTEDRLVPPSWSEEAAARLPRARLHLVEGAGHFVARDHWDAIFAGLRGDA